MIEGEYQMVLVRCRTTASRGGDLLQPVGDDGFSIAERAGTIRNTFFEAALLPSVRLVRAVPHPPETVALGGEGGRWRQLPVQGCQCRAHTRRLQALDVYRSPTSPTGSAARPARLRPSMVDAALLRQRKCRLPGPAT